MLAGDWRDDRRWVEGEKLGWPGLSDAKPGLRVGEQC